MHLKADTKVATSHVYRWVRIINDMLSSRAHGVKIDQETDWFAQNAKNVTVSSDELGLARLSLHELRVWHARLI